MVGAFRRSLRNIEAATTAITIIIIIVEITTGEKGSSTDVGVVEDCATLPDIELVRPKYDTVPVNDPVGISRKTANP